MCFLIMWSDLLYMLEDYPYHYEPQMLVIHRCLIATETRICHLISQTKKKKEKIPSINIHLNTLLKYSNIHLNIY